MFGIHDFGLFLAAGVLLNLTPGPDTAYILGRSLAHGRRAGVASALGICAGSIFHTCAAAFGLSAFLATSAWAFSAVKLAGAAYLIFLGLPTRCCNASMTCTCSQSSNGTNPLLLFGKAF